MNTYDNLMLSLDGLVVDELAYTNKRLKVRVANRYDAMIAAKTLRSEGYHGICKKEPSGSYTVDIRLPPIG